VDPDSPHKAGEGDIVLPEDYIAVTRITKPHAIITYGGGCWQIEDRGSSGGTYVNTQLQRSMQPVSLKNGDIIDLAIGENSARFVFISYE